MNIINSIRSRLFYKFLPRYVKYLNESQVVEDTTMPKHELDQIHIAQTKLIKDRTELLKYIPQDGIAAEVGVNKGEFSELILTLCKPKILHLVDAWSNSNYPSALGDLVEQKFKDQIKDKKVEINKGFSTEVLPKFPDEYFDFVYIDTDHSYQVTKEELKICNRIVKQDGIIAGHDFTIGYWNQRVRYGVVEAVHEFCVLYNWQMIYLTHEVNRHLSFALKRLPKD